MSLIETLRRGRWATTSRTEPNARATARGVAVRLLPLCILALATGPVTEAACNGNPECLFSTDFDQHANWEGCTVGPCGAGNACFPGDNGTSGSCSDHPFDPPRCVGCDPVPDNYNFYLSSNPTSGIGGKTCNINSREPWGGAGKSFFYRTGGPATNANDCVLSWWENGAQHKEMWVKLSVKYAPNFVLSGSNAGQKGPLRISHYRGDGNQSPYNPFFYNNSPQGHGPMAMGQLKRFGGSDVAAIFAPRCYGSGYFSCEEYASWRSSTTYIPNAVGTRFCAGQGTNGESSPTCTPADSPAGLDVSQCSSDATCSGPEVADGSFTGGGFDFGHSGHLTDGRYHSWKVQVVMNTSPGAANGQYRIWLDDQLIQSFTDAIYINASAASQIASDGNTTAAQIGFNTVSLAGNNVMPNFSGERWIAMDNLCVGTTEEAVDACYAGFTGGPVTAQCDDGVDNDGDGLTDTADPGCTDATDSSERGTTVCDDGLDNDGDGATDTADAGCSSPTDSDETNCGDGAVSGNEVCDGSDFGGQSCIDFGFSNPVGLSCNGSCSAIDSSACNNDAPPAACMRFDEVDDWVRVDDASSLTLPDGDWTVGIYARPTDLDGNGFQYAISNNNSSQNNSLNLYIAESNGQWNARIVDGDGTEKVLEGATIGDDSRYRLIILRRSNDLDMVYCDGVFGCGEADSTNINNLGAVNGGVWNIGRRADGDGARYFGGDLCYAFKVDRALSDDELVDAGRWLDPLAGEASLFLGGNLRQDTSANGNEGTYQGAPLPSPDGPILTPPSCGNNDRETGEACDGSDLNGATCVSQGFGGGNLSCSNCTFNTSGCTGSGDLPGTVPNVERADTTDN